MACSKPNLIARKGRGRPKFLGPYETYIQRHGEAATEEQIRAGKLVQVPCGQCPECKASRARDWGTRCELEARQYQNNVFVTLTYDDNNIPIHNTFTGEDYRGIRNAADYYLVGKRYEVPDLKKDDLTLFIKRMNKEAVKKGYSETGKSCRYYACGEYGGKTERSHYHLIIFGLMLPDLQFAYNKGGIAHFTSEWLTQKWSMGLVDVEEANYASARYVAGYLTKKHKNPRYYEHKGITKPYTVMSRRPGIGYMYWNDYRDQIYDAEWGDCITLKGGTVVRPPKYFDRLEDNMQRALEGKAAEDSAGIEYDSGETVAVHSKAMQRIHDRRRKIAEGAMQAKLHNTTKGRKEYAEVESQKHHNTEQLKGYFRRDKV